MHWNKETVMGIRISHGDIKTLAQFAVEAGKGEQKVRQAEQAAVTQRQQMSQDAQLQAQAMRQQTDIDMAIMDAQNRRSAMEFQSFMGAESARRNMAWEQDKMEQMRQHDLDMVMTRKELESAYTLEQEQREKSKTDLKLKALDDAVESGTISQATADNEKLRIEIGVSGRQSELYGEKDEASIFAELLKDRATTTAPAPTAPAKGKAEYAKNAEGVRMVSYDGRQTWQRIN
jgi:hypothetical protein